MFGPLVREKLLRLAALQLIIAVVFLAIVYADRLILDEVFQPYNLIPYIRFFHWVFFDVLATITFVGLAAVYVLARGRSAWKVGLGVIAEGVILMRMGMEDLMYYTLFREIVPSKLPWLSYNPLLISTTVIVSGAGLQLAAVISLAVIVLIWTLLWRSL